MPRPQAPACFYHPGENSSKIKNGSGGGGGGWGRGRMIFFFLCCVFLLFPHTLHATGGSSSSSSSNDDPVTLAIAKLRERLVSAPPDVPYAFPQTKYRLAILLESRLPRARGPSGTRSEDDNDASSAASHEAETAAAMIEEIAFLLEASAMNATHGLGPSARVEALTKAATLLLNNENNGGAKSKRAEEMLRRALDIRATTSTTTTVVVQIYLSQAAAAASHHQHQQPLLDEQQRQKQQAHDAGHYLQAARDLCTLGLELSPHEPVVYEYLGATLRRIYRIHRQHHPNHGNGKQRSNVSFLGNANQQNEHQLHEAYKNAAIKSHEAAVRATVAGQNDHDILLVPYGTFAGGLETSLVFQDDQGKTIALLSQLWTRVVHYIVLAAAAAREAGFRDEEDQHISYGLAILSHKTLGSWVTLEEQVELLMNAGISHKKRGEKQEAVAFFQRVLDIAPDDSHALVQLASLGGVPSSSSATTLSDSYVAGLFDGYSERFEEELVETLHYKGHEFVADAVLRHLNGVTDGRCTATATAKSEKGKELLVLDLGCGTGLMGGLLRERLHDSQANGPDAAQQQKDESCRLFNFNKNNVAIHGVDLSPRMVDIAKQRTLQKISGSHQEKTIFASNSESVPVYDTVRVSDATTFLKAYDSGTVGIIVASDVLIYIGALDELFVECARVLVGGDEGGLLSFTVEALPSGTTSNKNEQSEGLRLLASGRFGHSRDYVERAARQAGLELIEWKDEVLRQQGGQDVAGAVVTLRNR